MLSNASTDGSMWLLGIHSSSITGAGIQPSLLFEHRSIQQLCSLWVVVCLLTTAVLGYSVYYSAGVVALRSILKTHEDDKLIIPPLLPHGLPVVGGIPFRLLWDPLKYILTSRYLSKVLHPIRWRILTQDVYLVQGPANITALFKQRDLSGFFIHSEILYRCFGLPKDALKAYKKDKSGPFPDPHPGSYVEPRNRIEHRTFVSHHQLAQGAGYLPFCRRFEDSIYHRLQSVSPPKSQGWIMQKDFMDFFRHTATGPALTDAIIGKWLLGEDGDFLANFWTIDDQIILLICGIPRMLAPKVHGALRACLESVKNWHKWAKQQSESRINNKNFEEDDPFWGSKFIRDRQLLFADVDGQSAESMAAQDLGFLWGAAHNTVTSMFWMALDIFLRPDLLQKIRLEASSCIIERNETSLKFDTDALQQQPFLQAVFAETMRLRTHGCIPRRPMRDLDLNGWRFPKRNNIVACTTAAHMDSEFWASQKRGSYPADEFHPERFLQHSEEAQKPVFSMSGTEGSWFPFGGGVHACPGRRFVKFESLLTLALLVSLYDVEILLPESLIRMSAKRFGFGVLTPTDKLPYRIRRREFF